METTKLKAQLAIDLNKNELAVLKACMLAIIDCTRSEFGITDEVKVDSFSTKQIRGYLSQLKSKGYITLYPEFSQVHLTKRGCEALRFILQDDKSIESLEDIYLNI